MSVIKTKKKLSTSPSPYGGKGRSELSPSSSDFFRGFIDPRFAPPTMAKKHSKSQSYQTHNIASLTRTGYISNAPRARGARLSPSPPRMNLEHFLAKTVRSNIKSKADSTDPQTLKVMNQTDYKEPSALRQKTLRPKRLTAPKNALASPKSEMYESVNSPTGTDSELQTLKKLLMGTKQNDKKIGKKHKSKHMQLTEALLASQIEDFVASATSMPMPEKLVKKRRPKPPDGVPTSPNEAKGEEIKLSESSSQIATPEVNGNDDSYFSCNLSPKHNYPVLNENISAEGSMEMINKHVHTALSDWVRRKKQISQSMKLQENINKSLFTSADQEKEGVEVEIPQETSDVPLNQEATLKKSESSKSIEEGSSKVCDDLILSKISLPSENCVETQTFIEALYTEVSTETEPLLTNLNVDNVTNPSQVMPLKAPTLLPEMNSNPIKISPSVCTQTNLITQDDSMQVGKSLTSLDCPNMMDRAVGEDKEAETPTLIEIDNNFNSDLLLLSPLVDMPLTPLEPIKTSVLRVSHIDTEHLANAPDSWDFCLTKHDDTGLDCTKESTVNKTVDLFLPKSTEKIEIDLFEAEGGDKTDNYELLTEVSRDGGNLSFLDGQISTVGCSVSVLSLENKDMSPLVTSFNGDHANVQAEVKCYQFGTSPLVDIQTQHGYLFSHSVGNSGVSKTLSMTAYGAPSQRLFLTSPPPFIPNRVRSPASTQTTDETSAMCQVGQSLTSIPDVVAVPTVENSIPQATALKNPSWREQDLMDEFDYMDSGSLLNMPETIVQSINELDLGTNIEKISDTISTTLKAVTEIIIDLVNTEEVEQEPDSSDDDNDNEVTQERSQLALDEKLNIKPERFLTETSVESDDDEDEDNDDEFVLPASTVPSVVSSLHQCAPLDPTLSETSV